MLHLIKIKILINLEKLKIDLEQSLIKMTLAHPYLRQRRARL
jgi:hypothetical protein